MTDGPKTTHSIGDGSVQRGLVLPTWQRDGYQLPATDTALKEISELGAGWVQLVPTWYQPTVTSNTISSSAAGPDDKSIRKAVDSARRSGLKILLKPHVDLLNDDDRADIRPANRAEWFASYTAFITHYAELAAELNVEEFAVGTELSSVSDDREPWLRVVAEVRSRYRGTLVYAENHYAYTRVAFWDAVDIIGVDGYWPLSQQPTTDLAALKQALAPIRDQLAAFSAKTGRPILLTEMGYASLRGATTQPWNGSLTDTADQAEQAAAYRAVLETFDGQPWWAGVFWWVWRVLQTGSIDPPERLGFSARGKAAEGVLREWWGS